LEKILNIYNIPGFNDLPLKFIFNCYRKNISKKDLICEYQNCDNIKSIGKAGYKFNLTCYKHQDKTREIIANNNLKKYGVKNPSQMKEVKEKRKKTLLEKYGVDHPSKAKEIKEKKKETFLRKYGVENPMRLNEIKEKRKELFIKKYGVENPSQSEEIIIKRKKIFQERYGVTSPFQIPEIKEKIKEIIFERYGVENISQSKEIKEKKKKTLLINYGVENALQSPEIQEKIRKIFQDKYGVNYPGQAKEIQEKIKNTNQLKYNVDYFLESKEAQELITNILLEKYQITNPSQLPKVKEKKRLKSLKKYGTPHPIQSKEVKEKIKQTSLNKYGVNNPVQRNIKNFDKYNDKKFIEKNFLTEDKKFLVKKFMDFFNVKQPAAFNQIHKLNIEFNKHRGLSEAEISIKEYISELDQDIKIISGDREILNGKELDIYIPDYNFAIEYNGLYWHSEERKDKNYHLRKTNDCESKNIQLFHIFENEWINPIKKDIWKSMIANKLNKSDKKYFARKLKIKEVSSKDAAQFLEENHLQGKTRSPINIGLYSNDELISLITFSKPRYNKNYQYELNRFVSKKYSNCIGCASRLFKYFIKKYNPESIISYANRRIAFKNNNLYKTLGFNFINISEANYYYWDPNNPEKLYHRSAFQKHKLKDKKETKEFYDENKTEAQIMKEAGFLRIYDSGHLVYEWRK